MLADVIDVQHGDVVLVLIPPLGLLRARAGMVGRASLVPGSRDYGESQAQRPGRARLSVRAELGSASGQRARLSVRVRARGARLPHLVLVGDVDRDQRVRLLRTGACEHALGHVAQGAAGLGE